jgi:2-C-methyl-D-erythritol 4-phosphate cytidylyltransferase
MWRAVVLEWPELPDARRTALRAVVDGVVATAEGEGHLVVDERCPGLDAETLTTLLAAAGDGRARVGVRQVTDTVKRLRDGVVVGTVDRAGLVQLASPLVVPAAYGEPVGDSLPEMATGVGDVEPVEVPPAARRLGDVEELRLLLA